VPEHIAELFGFLFEQEDPQGEGGQPTQQDGEVAQPPSPATHTSSGTPDASSATD